MNNYYQALGVSESATPEILKIAFEGKLKALARGKLPEAERKAEEALLRQAFGTLSNPARRAAYDAQLEGAADREAAGSRKAAIGIAAGVVVALVGGVAWYMSERSSKLERVRRDEARIAQEAEDLRQRVAAEQAARERRERDASIAQERSERREVDERNRVERERASYQEEVERAQAVAVREAARARDRELQAAAEREAAELRDRAKSESDREAAIADVERQKRYLREKELEEERARAERHERATQAAAESRQRDAAREKSERDAELKRQRDEEAARRPYYIRR